MKRYVILPFPHSSEALWGPREGRHLARSPQKSEIFGGPEILRSLFERSSMGLGERETPYIIYKGRGQRRGKELKEGERRG